MQKHFPWSIWCHLLFACSFSSSKFTTQNKMFIVYSKKGAATSPLAGSIFGDLVLTLSLTTSSSGPGPASSQRWHRTIDKGDPCRLAADK